MIFEGPTYLPRKYILKNMQVEVNGPMDDTGHPYLHRKYLLSLSHF